MVSRMLLFVVYGIVLGAVVGLVAIGLGFDSDSAAEVTLNEFTGSLFGQSMFRFSSFELAAGGAALLVVLAYAILKNANEASALFAGASLAIATTAVILGSPVPALTYFMYAIFVLVASMLFSRLEPRFAMLRRFFVPQRV